jgi:hypothetical protein
MSNLDGLDLDLDKISDHCAQLILQKKYVEAALSGCKGIRDSVEEDIYDRLFYRETNLVVSTNNAPRWGGKRDIAVLTNGSQEEISDYVRGLKAAAVVTWIFFGLW